jgi:hypothetical protein
MSEFDELVFATHIERIKTAQAHPVPERVTAPNGPFSRELLAEPEIIHDYAPAFQDDHLPGATAQNNFNPPRYLRCALCSARVLEAETEFHVCEE